MTLLAVVRTIADLSCSAFVFNRYCGINYVQNDVLHTVYDGSESTSHDFNLLLSNCSRCFNNHVPTTHLLAETGVNAGILRMPVLLLW